MTFTAELKAMLEKRINFLIAHPEENCGNEIAKLIECARFFRESETN